MTPAFVYDAASDTRMEAAMVRNDGELLIFALEQVPAGDRFRLQLHGCRESFDAERVWMIARPASRVRLAVRLAKNQVSCLPRRRR